MRDMVDKIILRCGSMSPTTAEEVRDMIREVVELSYREGFFDGVDVSPMSSEDLLQGEIDEAWRNSRCCRAFRKTPDELEA